MNPAWKCPRCPQCNSEPVLALPAQAFCGNEECEAFCWNPTKTLDENLMNANFIDMPDWLG